MKLGNLNKCRNESSGRGNARSISALTRIFVKTIGLLLGGVLAVSSYAQTGYSSQEIIVKLKPVKSTIKSVDTLTELAPFIEKAEALYPASSSSKQSVSSSLSSNDTEPMVITLKSTISIDNAIRLLERNPEVEYVEPNYTIQINQLHTTDDLSNSQSHIQSSAMSGILDIEGEYDVKVAVVDTGVDVYHEDLADAICLNENEIPNNGIDDDQNGVVDDVYGASFYRSSIYGPTGNPEDVHGHGSHIAGIIAAVRNNGKGVTGISTKAKIIPVNFLDSSGNGFVSDAARAIRYAVDRGAKIINCSWGFSQYSTTLYNEIKYAKQNGVIVLAAAGNDTSSLIDYPARWDETLAIGSTDNNLNRAYFSNYGIKVDFATYGLNILSTTKHNMYTRKSGTSQSTAIMSGIVANMLSVDPTFSFEEVLTLLEASSINLSSVGLGYGFVNGDTLKLNMNHWEQNEALVSVPNTVNPSISSTSEDPSLTDVLNFPNPVVSDETAFGFNTNMMGTATVKIYSQSGHKLTELTQDTFSGYNTIEWNAKTESGELLRNGTYFYVVEVAGDQHLAKKGKLTILR